MRAADYIVEFLIQKGITDVFGYPGGMVTHLMDSFAKYSDRITAHVTYHEQGASFAACGYAQTSGRTGVAYATSGPGATNLITGICNAYFDSIPVLFITGQVNANEAKGAYGVRQRGFQETDIVSMVKLVTKYAVYVESVDMLAECLDTAFQEANSGRKGPVLLDIPMNVLREEIVAAYPSREIKSSRMDVTELVNALQIMLEDSTAPCILLGNGVKSAGCSKKIRKSIERLQVPSLTSMIAFDVLGDSPFNYGFIGAYGTRTANFIAAKSDLIISIGSRMDIRQVGFMRKNFAPNAKIVRFDIDPGELEYEVHQNEVQFCVDMETVVSVLEKLKITHNVLPWISVCNEIKNLLNEVDCNNITKLIEIISKATPPYAAITTDVGQNQVWIAQSFKIKEGQTVLFSGGHGAMGYSLPAAIGACYGMGKKPILCITGDGGMQMNIQELQFIAREQLPIKIVVLNNNALGMIRHFQEMYFEGRYFQTKPEGGYTAPDFAKIAEAYGISSRQMEAGAPLENLFSNDKPELVEILIKENTYVIPKLEFGKPNQDQEPLIDRVLYNKIMNLKIKD